MIFENNDLVEKFVEKNIDAILKDIARLVAVNSVEGNSAEKMPFGEGPAKALEVALKIAEQLGLNTINCENMMGYASVGESDRYIATITHLDVVPAPAWNEDPFIMREREGYIIGRGVMDDKGPSVLCLYALKFFKDYNIPLNYEIRALLGINEETGMNDINYYLANYSAPVFCFSPDAGFPLCNGEKGISQGEIKSTCSFSNILDIRGGYAVNAVPDTAEAIVIADNLFPTQGVEVDKQGKAWRITSHGISGHASMPNNTVNAIGVLAEYLLNNNILTSEAEQSFFELLLKLHSDFSGKTLGVSADDGIFEPLTIIGGTISMDNGVINQSWDSRYPTGETGETIRHKLEIAAGTNAEVTLLRDVAPFYMPADNAAVQVCLEAYNSVTGEDAKPYTMGGGTYARNFPNAISFGPEHPNRIHPAFAGPIHGVNEAASIEYFAEALKVYITALIRLQEIEF